MSLRRVPLVSALHPVLITRTGGALLLPWSGITAAVVVLFLTAAAPCRAQGSGVSLGLHGGVDALYGDDSGPAGEVVAGYRWGSGFELLAGSGLKFVLRGEGGPTGASPTGLVDVLVGPLELDHVHYFGEMRFWPWTPADGTEFPAGFFGLRAGSASKRGGGFDADGTAVGVTGGAEFGLTRTLGLSTSLVLDFVGLGEDENLSFADFDSWRAGLRVGLRALLGGE